MKPVATAVAALASAMLMVTKTSACSCSARPLCDNIENADVVVRAIATQRTEGDSDVLFPDVTYAVAVIIVYKGDLSGSSSDELTFATGYNSAACGIFLEIGEEYLLDLYGDSDDVLSASLCGAVQLWSSVSTEDLASLDDGCSDDSDIDLCFGACTEFQECVLSSEPTDDASYYCADVCDPSPCDDHEECSLEEVTCVQAPCPPVATCTDTSEVAAAGETESDEEETANSALSLGLGGFAAAVVSVGSFLGMQSEL